MSDSVSTCLCEYGNSIFFAVVFVNGDVRAVRPPGKAQRDGPWQVGKVRKKKFETCPISGKVITYAV